MTRRRRTPVCSLTGFPELACRVYPGSRHGFFEEFAQQVTPTVIDFLGGNTRQLSSYGLAGQLVTGPAKAPLPGCSGMSGEKSVECRGPGDGGRRPPRRPRLPQVVPVVVGYFFGRIGRAQVDQQRQHL